MTRLSDPRGDRQTTDAHDPRASADSASVAADAATGAVSSCTAPTDITPRVGKADGTGDPSAAGEPAGVGQAGSPDTTDTGPWGRSRVRHMFAELEYIEDLPPAMYRAKRTGGGVRLWSRLDATVATDRQRRCVDLRKGAAA